MRAGLAATSRSEVAFCWQYHVGSLSDFNAPFDPSWGRVKSVIHPIPGNHDYGTAGARGYFDYGTDLPREVACSRRRLRAKRAEDGLP